MFRPLLECLFFLKKNDRKGDELKTAPYRARKFKDLFIFVKNSTAKNIS